MSNRGRHKKKLLKYGGTWIHEVLSMAEIEYMVQGQHFSNNNKDLTVFEKEPFAGPSGGGFHFGTYGYMNRIYDPYEIAAKINRYKYNNRL